MSQTRTSISFLIGAGFSAPKGYPTGRKLNSLILNSKNENIAFHTSGSLVINIDGTKPDLGFTSSHQVEFDFFCELLEYYTTRQEELGSKYFGKLDIDGRTYMVRLERYTGNYKEKFRLYKLHGSLDYELFYRTENGTFVPDVYLKSRYGIGHTNQFKEVNYANGKIE